MIDTIDRQILDILQQDSRLPNKAIAEKIGLTQSATSERLRKLLDSRIIKSCEARINPESVGWGLLAFVFVRTSESAADERVGLQLAKIPEALEVFNVAGEDCYLLKVRAHDTVALSKLLREKIGALPNVTSTRTTIVMESFKETSQLPLSQNEPTSPDSEKKSRKRQAK